MLSSEDLDGKQKNCSSNDQWHVVENSNIYTTNYLEKLNTICRTKLPMKNYLFM